MKSARGGIVLGWFFKITILLALLAVVSFETGAVIVAKVTADRVAIDAASEAGQVYSSTGSLSKARAAAVQIATKDDAQVIHCDLIGEGKYVSVTIHKKASTFLVQHIGLLKRFASADSTHSGTVH
jgi:hypothetical protein